MALQMYFHMAQRLGLGDDSYRLARFAVTHTCSFYMALYCLGFNPEEWLTGLHGIPQAYGTTLEATR